MKNNKQTETFVRSVEVVTIFRAASLSYLFVCLYGVYSPTREFFFHMETSPLPVKGCIFWPMLGTNGHWAVRVPWHATPTVTQDIRFIHWWSPPTHDTHTYSRVLGSGAVTSCFKDVGLLQLGFEHPTFCLWGECFNRLRHRRGSFGVENWYWYN